MPSNKEAESRKAVTARLAEAGSSNVTLMVEAGRSSQKAHQESRAAVEKRFAKKEQADDAKKQSGKGTVSWLSLIVHEMRCSYGSC